MPVRRRRWLRRTLGTLAIAALSLAAAWVWLDSLFEEPQAMLVDSLPSHLGDKTVLGVFAHPDDELFVAGLLHDAAKARGLRVDTVTLTRGEAGYFEPHLCRKDDLGAVRSAESLKYGFPLGISGQEEIWDYPGGHPGFLLQWNLRPGTPDWAIPPTAHPAHRCWPSLVDRRRTLSLFRLHFPCRANSRSASGGSCANGLRA